MPAAIRHHPPRSAMIRRHPPYELTRLWSCYQSQDRLWVLRFPLALQTGGSGNIIADGRRSAPLTAVGRFPDVSFASHSSASVLNFETASARQFYNCRRMKSPQALARQVTPPTPQNSALIATPPSGSSPDETA